MSLFTRFLGLSLGLAFLASAVQAAPLMVSDAWARATVAGQSAGAAFMTIQSADAVQVVAVKTPVAPTAQIHEMAMSGSTMTMHAIAALDVPAKGQIKLSPGGTHIMLFGLTQPLTAGEHFPLTLSIKTGSGAMVDQTVLVEVRPLGN